MTLDSGERLRIRNYDLIGKQLIKNGVFEKRTCDEIMSRVKKRMTVLDVGANIGYYTVLMASRVGPSGRVVAFEPNPRMVDELRYNIELNNFSNVSIQRIALSDVSGSAILFLPEAGNEGFGSMRQNKNFEASQEISIKTEKLDDVLEGLEIEAVDFAKIDVEGAERLVFRGAKKLLSGKLKPTIVFECSENLTYAFGNRVYDVLSDLVALGYSVKEIDWGVWAATPL